MQLDVHFTVFQGKNIFKKHKERENPQVIIEIIAFYQQKILSLFLKGCCFWFFVFIK